MPIDQLTKFYRGVHSRVEWNEDKTGINKLHHSEEESWIALFIDLVYVAMFINVGHLLQNCGSNQDTVGSAFIIFLIMFMSRYSIDEYSNRFFADDIFHRLVYFIYTFGVFVMTMNISSEVADAHDDDHHRRLVENTSDLGNCEIHSDYSHGFFAGFIVTRLSLVALYSMISYYDKRGFQQFWVFIVRHGSSLIAMIILIFAHVSFSHALKIVGITELFCSMGIPLILRLPGLEGRALYQYHYPLDIYEVQSRLGIFVMMVLGESMIQQLTASYNTHHTNESYLFQGAAFLLIFCFGMQYFDAVHRKPGVPHALRTSLYSAVSFIWLHPIVSFLLLYATVYINEFYTSLQSGDDEVDDSVEWQLALSCFLISISLTLMRMLHKGVPYHFQKRSRLFHTIFRLSMASLHLLVYATPKTDRLAERLLEHSLIAFTLNCTDVVVNINTKNKKIARAISMASEAAEVRKSLGLSDNGDISTMVTPEEESYYVDFNDRNSLVQRSSILSAKERESNDDSDTQAFRTSDFASSTGKDARKKCVLQLNKSCAPSLTETLLDPVHEEDEV